MLIEAARRAEAAVKEMLAIANDGSATTDEFRDALGVSKSIAGINSAFQVAGAAAVAGRDRHGDGGAEVLAAAAGLSRREAHSQVKTAEALRALPGARDAIESGRVSVSNAKRLAQAVEKTSAEDVESDRELLAKAESMRPEQFAKEARRWAVERHGDGGESEHRRQRARRSVRIWDADDGMVHLHGEFDSVTGRRIGNRLRAEAAQMYDADKKVSKDSGHRRSFPQCMADALDNLTANNNAGGAGKPIADICVVAHVDDATGTLIAEIPGGDRLPPRCSKSSPATPRSHQPSTTRAARCCGRATASAPPPPRNSKHSRPSTAAASPAEPTSTCARPTTSNRYLKAGPPMSTIWCPPAGAATTRSTTSTGRSTAHPANAHCIPPTR